jgi:hypothetical protein
MGKPSIRASRHGGRRSAHSARRRSALLRGATALLATAAVATVLGLAGPARAGTPSANPNSGASKLGEAPKAGDAPKGGLAPAKPAAPATTASDVLNELWGKIELSTLWYLRVVWGNEKADNFSRAEVGRGYLTLKFKPAKWFESRFTLDTHQDDSGDWKVRLKYLYGKLKAPVETVVVSEPFVELGMVHNPWFDYEENIDNYRAEGTMFLERNGILNSADLGLTAGVLLGEKLPKDYQAEVSSKWPGRYGSLAVGFHNGGGYAALEANDNKTFMARASVRPLGFIAPHWSLSYFFVIGKGNTEAAPRWRLHNFMTSIEHQYFVLTGQVALGEGNQKGDAVDGAGDPVDLFGFSVFGEVKLPWIRSSLIGRYERFDWDTDGGKSPLSRVIAGHAFHFLPPNDLLFTMEQVSYSDPGIPTDRIVRATLKAEYP